MKKLIFLQLLVAASFTTANAQSLKDLLSKDNIENVVSTITGKSTSSMVGTWIYNGSAIEFESDNLLEKAGGTIAATAAEKKLDEQLSKIGITSETLSFTFSEDSTFTATLGTKKLSGTYSYNASTEKTKLKFAKLIGINTTINCTSSSMDMLFKSDILLNLLTLLGENSGSSSLQTISSLADNYDGMMMGFALKKE